MSGKRTVEETIKYFELLASEYEKKAVREQEEMAKAKYAAKAEAYELAAFELQHNMQTELSDKEKRAIHDAVRREDTMEDIANHSREHADAELTDEELSVAEKWLNEWGNYDCHSTYWENIEKSIDYIIDCRISETA